MRSSQVSRLPGMRDVTGRAYQRAREVVGRFEDHLRGKGYEAVDTPLLEEAELFARKSGGELTSKLYAFMDPGRHRVSLRPEFTSSVIRCFIQERDSLTLPVRWQYNGPVFRYQPSEDGMYRQFTQAGAELIGASGIEADAEVMSLAWSALEGMGMQDYRMRVGHLGVLHELLSGYGLSEAAKMFIIGNVQALKHGHTDAPKLMERAKDAGLLRSAAAYTVLPDGLEIGADTSREAVLAALGREKSEPFGRRTPEQIADRLLVKARHADDPAKVMAALDLVEQMARVEGDPEAAVERARQIAATQGLNTTAIQDLADMFPALYAKGVDEGRVTLDFGHALGISYYTGVIFELVSGPAAGATTLGSGGRYDGLVKTLGGEEVTALGVWLKRRAGGYGLHA